MTYKVIQWATGNVGRAAVKGILSRSDLELVGCFVYGPEKAGRDVGEICGLPATGVRATTDLDAILALDADCVVYTPLRGSRREVLRLLRSGKNVVTPVDWFYPAPTPAIAEIEAACLEAGVSLHGTGIHPGGITEKIPLMLSAFCRDIRHVRAEEFSDIRVYKAEVVVREIMQFGKPPESARTSPMAALLGGGFGQSIDMVAAGLGWRLDAEKRTTHEMAVATRRIETPVGPIEPGTVAAQRFTWQGTVGGEPVITARVNWLMGEEDLDPPWRFGEQGERFEVELTADPPLRATFQGLHPHDLHTPSHLLPGIVATAMHCVSSVPAVCAAPAGIRSYLDLGLVTGKAEC